MDCYYRNLAQVLTLFVLLQADLIAQDELDQSPVLRLETGGPRSYVAALAFSPNGGRLFAAGWDKTVMAWDITKNGTKYDIQYSSKNTVRTPVGGGTGEEGFLMAMALSEDGRWLAAAGSGPIRGTAGIGRGGWAGAIRALPLERKLDKGDIYVFDLVGGTASRLRGHSGNILSMSFVQGTKSKLPELVSAAFDWEDEKGRVKVWDVDKKGVIAELSQVPDGQKWVDLPPLNFTPCVVAWSTGNAPELARVALAWNDEVLRVWEVSTKRVASVKVNSDNMIVLPLSRKPGKLVTASHGQIKLLTIPPDVNGKLAELASAQLQTTLIPEVNGIRNQIPSAAVVLNRKNGKEPLAAFVVTTYLPNGQARYRILLTTLNPIKTLREIELNWTVGQRKPALAASPDGELLAVAGGEWNDIEVYRTDNLIGARQPEAVPLQSSGISFKDAQFVRSGESHGILLKKAREQAALVLDIPNRRIVPFNNDWNLAAPKADDFKLVDGNQSGKLVLHQIGQPNDKNLGLRLLESALMQHFSTSPASPPQRDFPLIAVASARKGEQFLEVFHGETGEKLRECAAHTERIRSVAFSADGRMLITSADDRTVCVWPMNDIGKLGRNEGVLFDRAQKDAVPLVRGTEKAEHPLKQGDEIIASIENGIEAEIKSLKEYDVFVRKQKPGTDVEFKVRRNGEVQNVKCKISRGVEIIPPLFTLFISPISKPGNVGAKNPESWEWIGWHPLGDFDSTGDTIQTRVGWHRNTGDLSHPAEFTEIGKYRGDFYHENLLEELIREQKLLPIIPKPDDPKISFRLRHPDGSEVAAGSYDGIATLRDPDVEIVATVSDVADQRKVNELLLNITERSAQGLPQAQQSIKLRKNGEDESEWVASLPKFGDRKTYDLEIIGLIADRSVKADGQAIYWPNAPTVDWKKELVWEIGIKGALFVNATVTASQEPAIVELHKLLPDGNNKVLQTWRLVPNAQKKIADPFVLPAGENYLELVARNTTALENAESQSLETAKSERMLVRVDVPPMAPSIKIDSVESVVRRATWQQITPELSGNYRTEFEELRIRATINGMMNLDEATIDTGDGLIPIRFEGFKPNQMTKFTIDHSFKLKAGPQKVVIASKIGQVQTDHKLLVVYDPPVAQIAFLTVSPIKIPNGPNLPLIAQADCFYQGYHQLEATVTAQLSRAPVNGEQVSIKVNGLSKDLIVKQPMIQETVTLRPGPNTVTLVVMNKSDWSKQASTVSTDVLFRRPPVVRQNPNIQVADGKLTLEFEIDSVVPLLTAKIEADGKDPITVAVADNKNPRASLVKGNVGAMYVLKAEMTGFPPGVHKVRVAATNTEEATLVHSEHSFDIEPAAVPVALPELELLHPADKIVFSEWFEFDYSTTSEVSGELAVRLLPPNLAPIELPPAPFVKGKEAKGTYTLRHPLVAGTNHIDVTAANKGGTTAKKTLRISYVTRAAAVNILKIGNVSVSPDGSVSGEGDQARPQLSGEVLLKNKPSAERKMWARTWVNNFKVPTTPVKVDPKNATRFTFETDITLGLPTKNRIRVEIYGDDGRPFPSDVASTDDVLLDSSKYEPRQDLYLMLLGTTEDAVQLKEDAMTAFKAKAKLGPSGPNGQPVENWESQFFNQIHTFTALNEYPNVVDSRFTTMTKAMKQLHKTRNSPHILAMVYFQGRISIQEGNFDFVINNAMNDPEKQQYPASRIEKHLNNIPGAHLLILDLTEEANLNAKDIWPKAPDLGIMVSNWNGNPNNGRLVRIIGQVLPQIKKAGDLVTMLERLVQPPEIIDRLRIHTETPVTSLTAVSDIFVD